MASAARDLRYNYNGYVSDNLARELDRELDREVREREFRHAGEPRREEAAAPKVRTAERPLVRERQRVSAFSVVGFAAVGILAVLVLMSYIQLTALSADMVSLKSQLSALETENVTLTAQHERMFDLDTVKAAAEAAGMTKPSASQIYSVDLSGGDSAVVYQQEEPGVLSRVLTSLNHGIYAVVEYFD